MAQCRLSGMLWRQQSDIVLMGWRVRPRVHAFWMQPAQCGRMERVAVVNQLPAARKIYLDADGNLLAVGDILKNPDMGRTYETDCQPREPRCSITGAIADQIEADMIGKWWVDYQTRTLSRCAPHRQPTFGRQLSRH